jgi:prevent-host-death family protein
MISYVYVYRILMSFRTKDIVPFSQARSRLSELAEEVKRGSEKIITKNGESYVALVDANKLDYYHELEREHAFIALMQEARDGMQDVVAGRHRSVKEAKALLRRK